MKKNKEKIRIFRISEDANRFLENYCKKHTTTPSKLFRLALTEFFQNHKEQ